MRIRLLGRRLLDLETSREIRTFASNVGCEAADAGVERSEAGGAIDGSSLIRSTKREDYFADVALSDERPEFRAKLEL